LAFAAFGGLPFEETDLAHNIVNDIDDKVLHSSKKTNALVYDQSGQINTRTVRQPH
jgi:hypothetical protein